MLFKKEDIGLYFIMSLIGTGVGILVGSYISSRITPDDEYEVLEEPGKEEKTEKRLNISPEELAEYQDIIEEYSPPDSYIDAFMRGSMALEEFRVAASNYRNNKWMQKPPLEDLMKSAEEEDWDDEEDEDEEEALFETVTPVPGWMVSKNNITEGEVRISEVFIDEDMKYFKRVHGNANRFIPVQSMGRMVPLEVSEYVLTCVDLWDQVYVIKDKAPNSPAAAYLVMSMEDQDV